MQQEHRRVTETSCHISVMPAEIVQWVAEIDPRLIIDGTFGGGGHSRCLLDAIDPQSSNGLNIIALDRDPAVSEREESAGQDPRIHLFLGSYEAVPKAFAAMEREQADAMILDLGLSSDQLADRERGFSFNDPDSPLDLRFDPENGQSAANWLLTHREEDIANTIYAYGEERLSRRIAREIVARRRREATIKTVGDLVSVCRKCVPRSKNHDIHPATRTFQALRIAVNDELGILERTIAAAPDWIAPGGRVAVISFHSLEDRIIKNAFRNDDRWNILTKKPLRPTSSEVQENPRSRSAKMRVAERVKPEQELGN